MGTVNCVEKTLEGPAICCSDPDLGIEASGAIFPFLNGLVPASDGDLGPGASVLYLFLLLWSFMGVATVSDVFMSAIEVITSKEKDVSVKTEEGEDRTVRVKLWNDTVANLTLMALGSSAPEILLSIIELLGNNWFSGELGPSTVVGSAAFNLFVISAVCVYSIPSGEVRYIIGTKVYAITAFFSIFAYVWLLIILKAPNSPDRVEIWEGVVTFLMFPFLVILAYCIDVDMFFTRKRADGSHVLYAMDDGKSVTPERLAKIRKDIKEEYMQALPEEAIMKLVVHRIEQQKPKSRAEYRIKATRDMVGGKKLESTIKDKEMEVTEIAIKPAGDGEATIGFVACKYACLECCVSIRLQVERNECKVPCSVAYETIDGTAKAGEDFVYQKGILEFAAGESRKEVEVKIVDDTSFEEDEEFYVLLSSPACEKPLALNDHKQCTVTIIDDDEPGQFQFTQDLYEIVEGPNVEAVLTVERKNGSSGTVTCQYRTEDGTAHAGDDYEGLKGELVFKHSETSKEIRVKIIDDEKYEKKETFAVHLSDATGGAKFTKSTQGGEEAAECTVSIVNDEKTKGYVDAISKHLALEMDGHRVGTANYADQFRAAFYTNGSQEEAAEVPWLSFDFLLHVLGFPWKMFFALIPPTDFADGKVCFCASLAFIGIVTAVVGDLANLLGCALDIPPDITAITFVALGTSLPDTFASKSAAVQDPYADASIGNVTGSNSVNVFLGLGLPWSMGAFYWHVNFEDKKEVWLMRGLGGKSTDTFLSAGYLEQYPDGGFMVPAGSLGFSVGVFCGLAVACVAYLALRRKLYGGELGGPAASRPVGAVLLTFFWLVYIIVSSMVSLEHIKV
jgi:solute carrier family 8 (sodium/calcium exchanger)